jgi:predicted negative regulator of RcsB-dependent stress response
MPTPDVVSALIQGGFSGILIVALYFAWKLFTSTQVSTIDRIDKIVDRHIAAESLAREQIDRLSTQNRDLFDKVLAVCRDLSANNQSLAAAVTDLRDATKSNERRRPSTSSRSRSPP